MVGFPCYSGRYRPRPVKQADGKTVRYTRHVMEQPPPGWNSEFLSICPLLQLDPVERFLRLRQSVRTEDAADRRTLCYAVNGFLCTLQCLTKLSLELAERGLTASRKSDCVGNIQFQILQPLVSVTAPFLSFFDPSTADVKGVLGTNRLAECFCFHFASCSCSLSAQLLQGEKPPLLARGPHRRKANSKGPVVVLGSP